ncbi:2-oxoisovalerate dehydrogenase E1 component [Sinobacterium caligoides]|uniref:2-oxoisovalerate dehydrogenase E1 component n=1 Tax=Sinobacterium caligoides TaxID=933926 RepID=A0A3N2DPT9_9GAMM|nr:alpha-ketoacid dehydrogenase subunit alpha/beta [Sinobacterium caligoides]ROS01844.1 2-oxoisovalerate dehydrogenase E1 component [Sinobacterium caligoides]
MNLNTLKEALLIRRTEEKLLELFSQGKLNGTVHTCIGEEMSAIAFAGQLKKDDFIFSNHRCHGHYLAYTKDTKGLLAELMGRKDGTCAGVGSSQHLCEGNFYSNGIQGGIVPVAAGMALANKLKGNNNIGAVFIGDGTLGQGVIYETMNMASNWDVPLVIICEDNGYAQTTIKDTSFSGDLRKRAEGFGLSYKEGSTWEYEELIDQAEKTFSEVRETHKPVFFHVKTYRLASHSKGDDTRSESVIAPFRKIDPINVFAANNPAEYSSILSEVDDEIQKVLSSISDEELTLDEYLNNTNSSLTRSDYEWTDIKPSSLRLVERLNKSLKKCMDDENSIFIGEDVLSPYGGAFKVAADLSTDYPQRVFSTPISEAGLIGMSNGLALAGMKPYAEIMFGDFILLALDQIINHASKFYHMYNKQVTCPIVIRTPMGGGRGYGPTHSQTLDKFMLGIDNVKLVAINKFLDTDAIYQPVHKESHPVIVIENKIDYGSTLLSKPKLGFSYQQSSHTYPVVKIAPKSIKPTITIVAYGGAAGVAEDILLPLFKEHEIVAEIIVPSLISPLDISPIIKSAAKTGYLFVMEENSKTGGFGSEVVAKLQETDADNKIECCRISSVQCPIPSIKNLETEALLNSQTAITTILSRVQQ